MNTKSELQQLLHLIRGIEHYIERWLKTLENESKIKEQGIEITQDKPIIEGDIETNTDWSF